MNFLFEKKILFYGHNGWIGEMFTKYLEQNKVNVIKGNARINRVSEVKHEIKKYKPTHIVSFTGRTHGTIDNKKINTIDYLEYPGKLVENIRDNLAGPLTLAKLCKEKGIHYTYLGTGCIFDYTSEKKNDIFDEDALPNYFGSSYSIVKGFTDTMMKEYPALNLRIRMPISSVPDPRNFITKIVNYPKICSIQNSMTVLDDFFPIFMDLILKSKTGTYNCTNPGTIEHNEILKLYSEIIDSTIKWENITIHQQDTFLKSRRSNNQLDTSKLQKKYRIKSITASVKNILYLMKNKNKK
jgi:dTDP-4-dehydrorhamnose reductase